MKVSCNTPENLIFEYIPAKISVSDTLGFLETLKKKSFLQLLFI